MIPYLVLAEAQNTALAAILTFSDRVTDRVIYPAYAAAPRLADLSALEDQAIAGVRLTRSTSPRTHCAEWDLGPIDFCDGGDAWWAEFQTAGGRGQ